jgi:enamine deaminase RidA (YjgF/YER057c/UK114 family)
VRILDSRPDVAARPDSAWHQGIPVVAGPVARDDGVTIQRFENGSRFCRALSHNGTVYLAGMTADDTSGDVIAQTRDTLAKIDHYLAMAGSDKSRLLTALIWLRDIADFDRMNGVWDAWIDRSAMPVRATVEARLAGDNYRVEIMVTAAL